MREKIMIADVKGAKKRPGDSFTGPKSIMGSRKTKKHFLERKNDEIRTTRDYRTTIINGK